MESLLLSLAEIEPRVCDVAAEQLGLLRREVRPESRLIQDLHCDSLDFVELLMEIEDEFGVSLPDDPSDMTVKQVFTRDPFRLRDLAEAVYLCQQSPPHPARTRVELSPIAVPPAASFTQIGGQLGPDADRARKQFERLGKNPQGFRSFRRATDGMICVVVPGVKVSIGADGGASDEGPSHAVWLDDFVIDREPVSTTAYCRFLNSVDASEAQLAEWFVLTSDDKRREHELVKRTTSGFSPLAGTERMPMMLVSWYGASAYSLWVNRRDWRDYRDADQAFLPSEAQWEYAARGTEPRQYPWGDDQPTAQHMRYAQHDPGRTYAPHTLPLADVNTKLGLSPFGLHHMAGNVWQWCRDWYAPDFYRTAAAREANAVNRQQTGVHSERGGSWIGSAALCRSSYRRGRVPSARGRCLGFRCISDMDEVLG